MRTDSAVTSRVFFSFMMILLLSVVMDDLRPRVALFLGLRPVLQPGGLHDIAKGEKGRRIGVTFRIAVTQRLIVSVQDGALSTPFFIVLQETAGTFGAALAGSLHMLSTILSVSCRQPLRTCAKMRFTPRLICFQKKTGS